MLSIIIGSGVHVLKSEKAYNDAIAEMDGMIAQTTDEVTRLSLIARKADLEAGLQAFRAEKAAQQQTKSSQDITKNIALYGGAALGILALVLNV